MIVGMKSHDQVCHTHTSRAQVLFYLSLMPISQKQNGQCSLEVDIYTYADTSFLRKYLTQVYSHVNIKSFLFPVLSVVVDRELLCSYLVVMLYSHKCRY